MGRPPCCDKAGIKKGPWTPEEDIILVSYIQEHGPGNWRSVPTNTGLLRCSKSCRLRWTNYLRPGIKRGNFTSHEEGMIIHLQALLGNKWAAIASYLPQRTDNDIKNYWNTHLKKKLKKFQSSMDPRCMAQDSDQFAASNIDIVERSRSLDSFTSQANNSSSASAAPATGRLNQGATYASSAENISRLLEGWMRSSPKCNNADANSVPAPPLQATVGHNKPKAECGQGFCDPLISNEELESILSFENVNSISWDKGDSTSKVGDPKEVIVPAAMSKQTSEISSTSNNNNNNNPPLTFLEKWLLDESSAGQVEEMSQMMELSSIF